jgi:hypothetical protein
MGIPHQLTSAPQIQEQGDCDESRLSVIMKKIGMSMECGLDKIRITFELELSAFLEVCPLVCP